VHILGVTTFGTPDTSGNTGTGGGNNSSVKPSIYIGWGSAFNSNNLVQVSNELTVYEILFGGEARSSAIRPTTQRPGFPGCQALRVTPSTSGKAGAAAFSGVWVFRLHRKRQSTGQLVSLGKTFKRPSPAPA
jgi:hypothetical protein